MSIINPSTQNLTNAFDPTGAASITGAQLMQLLTAATPYTDKGLLVITDDIAGDPQVPDARAGTGDVILRKYIWIRRADPDVYAYVWNPNATEDATYLNWVQINRTTALISTADVANLAITNAKVNDVDWSKLSGIPATFAPGGAAGGDLDGQYPNPTILQTKKDVLQRLAWTYHGAMPLVTTVMSETAPTIAGGTQYINYAFTPLSATSIIRVTWTGFFGVSTDESAWATFAIFVNSVCKAFHGVQYQSTAPVRLTNGYTTIEAIVPSWGLTAQNIALRYGVSVATNNGAILGQLNNTIDVVIEEITGTLTVLL